jgi:hypothetical protein
MIANIKKKETKKISIVWKVCDTCKKITQMKKMLILMKNAKTLLKNCNKLI